MMRALLSSASLALALACVMPVAAAVGDDVKTCVRTLHDAGRPPQSHIKACTLAVNSGELDDRQLSMVLFARATLYSRSGSIDEARRDYTQAAMLNRSPGFAAFVKGAVARAEGDSIGTVRALSEALSHSPDSVDMLVWRGDAHYRMGECEDALRDYEQALKRAPTLFAARTGRGVALIGLGRSDVALGLLEDARRQQPDHVPTLVALARARLDVGDLLGAVATVRIAEGLWPREPTLRFHAARLHLIVGDKEGGLRRLENTVVTRSWFEFEASVIRFLTNRETSPDLHAGALVAVAQNGGAEPWHLPLAHFLATAFPSDDKQAPKYPTVTIEQLLEAAEVSGREHLIWFYVGEVRRLKGDTDGARAAFRQVFEIGLMDTWEYRESIRRLRDLK